MQWPILVVGGNKKQCQELCAALEVENCRTTAVFSLLNLEKTIYDAARHVVIVDLDSLPVDNRIIINFRKRHPDVCILAVSSRSFHPELKEAMSSHIYACLGKPVDTEELIYWIRSIYEDALSSRDSPET